MKTEIQWILFLFLFFHFKQAIGQEPNQEDQLMPENEEQIQFQLNQSISIACEHKIDLDQKNLHALVVERIISRKQEMAFEKHIDRFGEINDIEEFTLIENFDPMTIQRIKQCVNLNQSPSLKTKNQIDEKWIQKLQLIGNKPFRQIEDSKGFRGDMNRYIMKYRANYLKRIQMGFQIEKDQGERIIERHSMNAFYSAHLQLKNFGSLRNLILGDYQLSFGQNLTLANYTPLRKSADFLLIGRSSFKVRPNNSINEFSYLRGVTGEMNILGFTVIPFLSYRYFDAKVTDGTYTSKKTSILRRTSNEIEFSNSLRSQLMGINMIKKINALELGMIVFHRTENAQMIKNQDINLQLFESEQHLYKAGIYFEYDYQYGQLFGEISQCIGRGGAQVLGIESHLSNRLQVAIHLRNFEIDFDPEYSMAFGERNANRNERGIYAALRYEANNQTTISLSSDQFIYPWVPYQHSKPITGNEYRFLIKIGSPKYSEWQVIIRSKEIPSALNNNAAFYDYEPSIRQNLRMQYLHMFSRHLRYRIRFSYSIHREAENSRGHLLFNEFKYKKLGTRWSLLLRYSIFDTDDYDSRIYSYEQDLAGYSSIPAYYESGSNLLLIMQWKIYHNMKTGIRYSHTSFVHSGRKNQDVQQADRSDIKWSISWKF